MSVPSELVTEVLAWIADDPDTGDAAELQALLDAAATAELTDRFAGPLTFGTAGLRGPLRAGPNGMNTAVVRRAAAGIAAQLQADGHAGRIVVIGYDGRHRSREFAQDSAAVFAAAGFDARLLPRLLPTPVLAFAVQRLHAGAGIMVTASHNPPQDNGYKVYAADGAQIVPPIDVGIEARIRAIGSVRAIPLSPNYSMLGESIVDDYVQAIASLVAPDSPRQLSMVHTAMHGVGTEVVRAVFAAAGFPPPHEVAEQSAPDPEFSTVSFPNPEEPGAMDLALALAVRTGADLLIANDPDADRCAVGVRFPAGWRMLRGDEVGVLLADWLLTKGVRGTYATTIVSSSMLAAIAAAHEVPFAETLTGFKWISRAAPDLVYGYEEALGYAVAPSLVRDKDGISAALLVAELAAVLKANASSIPRRLAELAAEYGLFATRQLSWRVADLALIDQAMGRLRANPPIVLLGQPVTVTDLAPDNDVLTLRFQGGRAVVRPSGTEPKCKAYLQIVIAAANDLSAAEARAEAALDELASALTEVLAL
ncbi:MAG TPA: phospho-sugar mutase [Jatrophihabitans sp.]|nr:phospho-sugar mutase [Jatrophihabitans sp.]